MSRRHSFIALAAVLAIPLASIDLTPPTKDSPWQVNFGRNYFYRNNNGWQSEISSWRPTFGSTHLTERFGVLYFEEK